MVRRRNEGPNVYKRYREQIFMLGNEPEQPDNKSKNSRDAQADGKSGEADVGYTVRVFEQRVADDGDWQA